MSKRRHFSAVMREEFGLGKMVERGGIIYKGGKERKRAGENGVINKGIDK